MPDDDFVGELVDGQVIDFGVMSLSEAQLAVKNVPSFNLSATSFFLSYCFLSQSRHIVKRLHRSTALRKKFENMASSHNEDPTLPTLDVPTRWNSTRATLLSIIRVPNSFRELAQSISCTAEERRWTGGPSFALSDKEWALLNMLSDFLKVFFLAQFCNLKKIFQDFS